LQVLFLIAKNMSEELKDRIAQIMEREHIATQKEFADACGISQGTITHLKQGRNNLSLNNAQKICEQFHINLEWLMYGTGELQGDMPAAEPTLFDRQLSMSFETHAAEQPPPRRITEIRVYFDDDTFQVFKSEK
jgi:transcriptional regulator with XRE-family HTH domain